jgi:pimeloyl-ACP methyl ester carboxylesterase
MSAVTLLRPTLAVLALLQLTPWVDPTPHRVQLVPVGEGVQLEVLDFGGTRRPIVLLAGLGNTAHVFDEFAPKLTSLGHIYAITRRGYGASSRPESGYDVARLGEDVLAVLDTLRIETPVLIGHSIAGEEMSYLAVEHRNRISALIYLEAAYRYAWDVPGEFEKDFPTLPPLPALPSTPPPVGRQPFVLPEAERHQGPRSPTAGQAILAGGRQFTGIALPTLAIFASPHDIGSATPDPAFDQFDEAVTERQARAVERGIAGARVLRWPHASHYLFLTREDDVIREVTTFIAGLR